jgi:hypothetical protein
VVHDDTAYPQDRLRESFRTNNPYDAGSRRINCWIQITGVPEEFVAYCPGIRSANIDDPAVPSILLDGYDQPKLDAARCKGNESFSLRQSMHMLVGDTVNRKISHERGTLAKCLNCKGNSRGSVNPLASP